ncbi:non-classical arabinogalactan protein 31-like [Rutidosis leptorrhynchoides]|uniref:non-classical arabinogalactan protein 31-like n=1 Tax=Rutidosis leptorrhynchoides TaxID=125765 RepID=UPI003A9A2D89
MTKLAFYVSLLVLLSSTTLVFSTAPGAPGSVAHKNATKSYVAVQGVVYCKSCKYAGIPTLLNATTVCGATVSLKCFKKTKPFQVIGKTDAKGYFYITPKKVSKNGARKCRVSLLSSPNKNCSLASNLHFGAVGAPIEANQDLQRL